MLPKTPKDGLLRADGISIKEAHIKLGFQLRGNGNTLHKALTRAFIHRVTKLPKHSHDRKSCCPTPIVGEYPQGASPFGVEDMIGTV